MTQTVCILGRQPALGMAELESIYGSDALKPIGTEAVLINVDPSQINLDFLGGTVKVCKLLTELPYTSWDQLITYISDTLPAHVPLIPEGKIKFGLSVHGIKTNIPEINRSTLGIKRVIQELGRSVRVVPNSQPALNTAQVIHNQLTGLTGMELILIDNGQSTFLVQTVAVQDIEAYAARDQKRPKRDARVGMLPPKLAQIIINLARPTQNSTILDPFCGTGVILQEALLMGYNVCGTDIDPRMVEYAATNIEWLRDQYPDLIGLVSINQGDATNYNWSQGISAIASETYLGRPFSALPKPEVINEVRNDVDTIHKKFLKNAASQTEAGLLLCLGVPAWKTKSGFLHLKTLDHLEELGYTRTSFVHAKTSDLIYHRPDQIVGRELVVLKRI